jgi:hypothetical protein
MRGERIDVMALLADPGQTTREVAVWVKGLPRALRLVIQPLSAEAAERQRTRRMRKANRIGHKINPRTVQAAGFLLLLTSLAMPAQPAERIGALSSPLAGGDRHQTDEDPGRIGCAALGRSGPGANLVAGASDCRGSDRRSRQPDRRFPPGRVRRRARRNRSGVPGPRHARSCSTPFSPSRNSPRAPHSRAFAAASRRPEAPRRRMLQACHLRPP